MLRHLDSVRCTNTRAVLAGLETFGPSKRKLNNGTLPSYHPIVCLQAYQAQQRRAALARTLT